SACPNRASTAPYVSVCIVRIVQLVLYSPQTEALCYVEGCDWDGTAAKQATQEAFGSRGRRSPPRPSPRTNEAHSRSRGEVGELPLSYLAGLTVPMNTAPVSTATSRPASMPASIVSAEVSGWPFTLFASGRVPSPGIWVNVATQSPLVSPSALQVTK